MRVRLSPIISYRISPRSTFNVLVLGEGFQDETTFNSTCDDAARRLLALTPFTGTRPNWVNVYNAFSPSVDRGPPAGSGTPGNTAFSSTFDRATGQLAYDPDKVTSFVATLVVHWSSTEPDIPATELWPVGTGRFGPAGSIIVILGPSVVGGNPISAEAEWPDRNFMGSVNSVFFNGTSLDGNWENAIARAIAHAMGLGYEDELPGPSFLAPAAADIDVVDSYPNLMYAPSAPTGQLTPADKWYWKLTTAERRAGLTVVPHPGPANTPDIAPHTPIPANAQLVEGGGGYRTQVYRAFPDCLMRRPINGGTLGIKDPKIKFCRLCSDFLQIAVAGRLGPIGAKRIEQQRLIYDEVDWSAPIKTALTSVSAQTPIGTGPYWTFDVSANGGLTIKNLRLRDQPGTPTRNPDVLEEISFSDLEVTFRGDATPTIFDPAAASTKITVVQAQDGQVSPKDNNYRHGLKVTLENNFGGACPVRVELSLVLKGVKNDIDPGGMVNAVKLYPQIAMTWFRGGTKSVTSFRGCVKLILNNFRDSANMKNISSFFTDSNTSDNDHRSRDAERTAGLPGLPWPNWFNVFDCFRGDLRQEVELTGVYSLSHDPTNRKKDYNWPIPASSTNAITLAKVSRQGAHDNIHTHADMGTPDKFGNTMVHAPFCAEACLYMHWRWGTFSQDHSSDPKERFLGWGTDRGNLLSNSVRDAPLLPPSHQLRVAVTQPGIDRRVPPNVLGPAPLEVGSNALDPLRKQYWYTVDIESPAVGRPQAILEHGLGFAFQYFDDFWAKRLVGRAGGDKNNLDIGYHVVYDVIRYLTNPTRTNQIPDGNATPNDGSGITMELL